MPTLTELVHELAGRTGVNTVVVVSPDGLPISHAGQVHDAEALAALTVTLVRSARRLAEGTPVGAVARLVLEGEAGLALLGAVRNGNWIIVLTDSDADVGALLYDLRREGPALAAQL